MATFYKGDCLQTLKTLPQNSVKLIYWNPPFGTTEQHWDEALDWPQIFSECFRILRSDGMLVIHCSIPFNYSLIRAAPKPPLYSWYWKKEGPTCPLIANKQPLRIVEEILVWKKKTTTYNRQQIGEEAREILTVDKSDYYKKNLSERTKTVLKGKTRTHLIDMPRKIDGFSTRSEEMIELFIKSYTDPGDTVLDPTCYLGLTGRVCKRMDRKWIGIDKHFYPLRLLS
jgi:site-specific DNA-methyltransferase (adenine-specific)